MPNHKKFSFITLYITLASALLFTFARLFLLFFNYDFSVGFFESKALTTAYYIILILVSLVLAVIIKKGNAHCEYDFSNSSASTLFSIALAIGFVFIAFATAKAPVSSIPLEKIANSISIIFAFITIIYYLLSAFISNPFITVLNLAPIFFLIFTIISAFINQSVHANSYNDFSEIIALLSIAFLILYKGKATISKSASSVLPITSLAIILLMQSAIPDVIILISKKAEFTIVEIALLVMRILYLFYAIAESVILTNKVCEDKE